MDVVPHCGVNNRNLVAHLALVVPESGSYQLDVGGTKMSWTPGELLLFDESFRHTVKARPGVAADKQPFARIVLIFRVPHPDLPAS